MLDFSSGAAFIWPGKTTGGKGPLWQALTPNNSFDADDLLCSTSSSKCVFFFCLIRDFQRISVLFLW